MSTVLPWCEHIEGRKPDQWHDMCPGRVVSAMGVAKVCECPRHEVGDE